MSRSIISAVLILVGSTICWAQEDSTIVVVSDTTVSYRPTGLRLGADLVGPAKIFFSNQLKEWEISADIDFNKYYLSIDYGQARQTLEGSDFIETNKGSFFRIGPEVNLTKPGPHILFFGVKRGMATHSDTFSGDADYGYWGTGSISKNQKNIKSNWWEVNLGMKVQLVRSIYIGFTTRLKFGLKHKGDLVDIDPSYIAGYGKTSLDNTWGFTYSAYYRIPFNKN